MSDEHKSLNEIIRFRKEKLDTLRERGVNPYPYNYKPTHTSGEILENYDDLEKKRCHRCRPHHGTAQDG